MTKKRLLQTITLVAALCRARAGHAQFAVVDAGNITQSVMTVANTAQTVARLKEQIDFMQTQATQQLQRLQTLDPTSFSSVKGLLNEGTQTYQSIRSDVGSMGFAVQEVNRDFDTLFPKDQAKWKTVKQSDYDGYYSRWNTELTSSSKSAERAQASILAVEKNNLAIADILSRSQGSAGEIRQLQLINEQLALIHQEMGSLVQNLTTTGRVLANVAASSAGEKMLTREAKSRRRDGYTNLGRPAPVLRRLP